MRRSGAEHAEDDDLSALFDPLERARELSEHFSSALISTYADAERASPPRTPPRTPTSAYDDIPTATVLPQSPILSRYGVHSVSQSPQRAMHQTPYGSDLTGSSASAYSRSSHQANDAHLAQGMFQLNLSPTSPASSFGVSLTSPRSPAYGGYGDQGGNSRDDGARSLSASPAYGGGASPGSPKQQHSLYKTELCRSWEESGSCRYGAKCQFAHGRDELRPVLRHPKYKTEVCRTFAAQGNCPYGSRCRFIHYRPNDVASTGEMATQHRTALSALISGASTGATDWGDAFLGTPAPLDPRPARRAAFRDDSALVDDATLTTTDDRSTARAVPGAVPERTTDVKPVSLTTTTDPSAARVSARASDDVSDDDDDDDDALRRLPVFASIAASPERDIFDHP